MMHAYGVPGVLGEINAGFAAAAARKHAKVHAPCPASRRRPHRPPALSHCPHSPSASGVQLSSNPMLTVGALTSGPAWMSGGAPDMYCRVSGAPCRACLPSARSGAHLMPLQVTVGAEVAVAPLLHRTVRCTPDMSGEL
jgi:hypothetical protein